MPKEIFVVRNWITLQAAILDRSESAVHIHPFSEIFLENTGGRVLLLNKLQTDYSGYWLYTKMAPPRMFSSKSSSWTVQKQLSTAIHFRKIILKISVVESFLWSNYRLAVQSSGYILKWLHQECFLENLPKAFGVHKYQNCKYYFYWSKFFLSSKGDILRMSNICLHLHIFLWIIFFQLVPRKSLSVCFN